MTERVEWEVIDEPSGSSGASSGGPGGRMPPPMSSPQQMLRMIFGRWWRWKVAGLVALAAAAVALLVAVAGVALVTMVAIGVLSLAIASVRRWLGRSGGAVARRGPGA